MLLIPCPWCGARAQSEFSYGGDATLKRPAPDGPATLAEVLHGATAPIAARPVRRSLGFHTTLVTT